jgi:hypothetical protein
MRVFLVADLHHNFHLSYPTTWGIIFLLRFYLVLFNISTGIRSCFFVVSIQRAHCFCHNSLSIHVFQDSEASEVVVLQSFLYGFWLMIILWFWFVCSTTWISFHLYPLLDCFFMQFFVLSILSTSIAVAVPWCHRLLTWVKSLDIIVPLGFMFELFPLNLKTTVFAELSL